MVYLNTASTAHSCPQRTADTAGDCHPPDQFQRTDHEDGMVGTASVSNSC